MTVSGDLRAREKKQKHCLKNSEESGEQGLKGGL